MKKHILISAVVMSLIWISACVREVFFQDSAPNNDVLVVDALLTDGFGPHTVRLTRLADYADRNFPNISDATVVLSDDQGNTWAFKYTIPALGRPYYELKDMKGETGRTYILDITLSDGSKYRSKPQVMPEKIPIDSASTKGQSIPYTFLDGAVRFEDYIGLYAHTAPQRTDGYLYWEMDAVYVFDESENNLPLRRCYITDYFNRNNLPLYDLSKRAAGSALNERVGLKRIDESLRHGVGFSLYQRSITKDAYEYLTKAKSLINQTGTIFDQSPAIPIGNMFKVDDEKETVLGIFVVAAADTTHTIVLNGELGTQYYVNPDYCRFRFGSVPPPGCLNCLSLNRSVYEKPIWWNR